MFVPCYPILFCFSNSLDMRSSSFFFFNGKKRSSWTVHGFQPHALWASSELFPKLIVHHVNFFSFFPPFFSFLVSLQIRLDGAVFRLSFPVSVVFGSCILSSHFKRKEAPLLSLLVSLRGRYNSSAFSGGTEDRRPRSSGLSMVSPSPKGRPQKRENGKIPE